MKFCSLSSMPRIQCHSGKRKKRTCIKLHGRKKERNMRNFFLRFK